MIPPLVLLAGVGKITAVALWFFTTQHAAALLFFFGLDPFVLYAVFVPSGQGLVRVFTRFATDRSEIWLTIDDGPDPEDTPKILDLLEQKQDAPKTIVDKPRFIVESRDRTGKVTKFRVENGL